MLFTTAVFTLLFLPASLFFYGYWMPAFTLLLLASIAVNFWLRFQPQQLLASLTTWITPTQQKPTVAKGVDGLGAAATDAVLKDFFNRLGPAQGFGRVLFVVDGSHSPQASPLAAGLQTERRALMTAVHEWGGLVLDAEAVYAAHHARSKRSLNVGPYDQHLNGLGVQLLFGAAAQRLQGRS